MQPDGTLSRTYTGRTVIFQEEGAGASNAIIYAEYISASENNRVVFADGELTITFFFRRGQHFPSTIVIVGGSRQTYVVYLSAYDYGTETFSTTFVRGAEYETIRNIPLSLDFLMFECDFELSRSQNRRIHNAVVASSVHNSLSAHFGTFPRGRSSQNITKGVSEFFHAEDFQRLSSLMASVSFGDQEAVPEARRSLTGTLILVGKVILRSAVDRFIAQPLLDLTSNVVSNILNPPPPTTVSRR